MKFLIGADPEIIVAKDNVPVSAERLVGGRKDNPLVIDGIPLIEDNILIEYNTNPAPTLYAFIQEHIRALRVIYKNFLLPNNMTIYPNCYGIFSDRELATDQASMFGCDPEFDARTMDIIIPPDASEVRGRSAGGHIHIGYEGENLDTSMMLVKFLDIHLGIPSLIIDEETRRRNLYGKASSFRHDPGLKVEYRTLSNFWIFSSEHIIWVYKTVKKILDFIEQGCIIDEDLYDQAYKIINANDTNAAMKFIAENQFIELPQKGSLNILIAVQQPLNTKIDEIINSFSEELDIKEIFDAEAASEDNIDTIMANTLSMSKKKPSFNKDAFAAEFISAPTRAKRDFRTGEYVVVDYNLRNDYTSTPPSISSDAFTGVGTNIRLESNTRLGTSGDFVAEPVNNTNLTIPVTDEYVTRMARIVAGRDRIQEQIGLNSYSKLREFIYMISQAENVSANLLSVYDLRREVYSEILRELSIVLSNPNNNNPRRYVNTYVQQGVVFADDSPIKRASIQFLDYEDNLQLFFFPIYLDLYIHEITGLSIQVFPVMNTAAQNAGINRVRFIGGYNIIDHTSSHNFGSIFKEIENYLAGTDRTALEPIDFEEEEAFNDEPVPFPEDPPIGDI